MKSDIRPGIRVGAVIPVFNRSSELQVLLASLTKQTFAQGIGRLDILIVDNGSTDGGLDRVFPDCITLLSLPANLGACKGFNRGMQCLLSRGVYDYLWLLDSDLWAAPDALERLVAVMESNPRIGLAGSLIVNVHDHGVVVEAGAMIDLSRGSIRPLLCNEPRREVAQILSVDYVGSGVSLLRVEAARQAGYYDERYHFLWEDMDYGLFMQRCGWLVVAVTDSVVYHPPFSEKRSASVDAYYGVRNPIVTISKYSGAFARIPALYAFLMRSCKLLVFRWLNGANSLSALTWHALCDFIIGRLGSFDRPLAEETPRDAGGTENAVACQPYIILPSGNLQTIAAIIQYIKEQGGGEITLVIQEYRTALFRALPIDQFILYDDKSSHLFLEHLRIFITLLFTPGIIINSDPLRGSPFTYSHRLATTWDATNGKLRISNETIFSLWKLVIAVIVGGMLALILLIPTLMRSYSLKPERCNLEIG